MSGGTCPNGHLSGDSEWCDTCGAPMSGQSAASSGAAPVVAPVSAVVPLEPVACPHCGAANSADNLFCESCGYDFTTGQAPDPIVGSEAPVDVVEAPVVATWIVVVEVDPLWYAVKGELADRPLPPASTSTVPLTHHASLVGRTSQSRGLHPEIALDADTAVSRRHAQFVVDGDKLSVVDLSSTNGTYVAGAGSAPTDDLAALASGVPAALQDGDHIFVGAWTRLTVRRA
jgi:FHA domain/Double zinc ribbon